MYVVIILCILHSIKTPSSAQSNYLPANIEHRVDQIIQSLLSAEVKQRDDGLANLKQFLDDDSTFEVEGVDGQKLVHSVRHSLWALGRGALAGTLVESDRKKLYLLIHLLIEEQRRLSVNEIAPLLLMICDTEMPGGRTYSDVVYSWMNSKLHKVLVCGSNVGAKE